MTTALSDIQGPSALTGSGTNGQEPWLAPLLERLAMLLRLPPNWNSYGARPIHPAAVRNVIRLLTEVMDDATPAPNVVPTAAGHVGLAWNLRENSLEIEVSPRDLVQVAWESFATGDEWDGDMDLSDLSRLQEFVRQLSRERSDALAAA
jgi:hypothetical protein